MVLSQVSRSTPPAFFRSRAFSGFRFFPCFQGTGSSSGTVRAGMAAGLLLSACGSADAVSGETGRRMPFGGVRSRRGRSGMCPAPPAVLRGGGNIECPGPVGKGAFLKLISVIL